MWSTMSSTGPVFDTVIICCREQPTTVAGKVVLVGVALIVGESPTPSALRIRGNTCVGSLPAVTTTVPVFGPAGADGLKTTGTASEPPGWMTCGKTGPWAMVNA